MRSVVAQTVTDFECIVVDDASSQPIASVVHEFDGRFRYVRRDHNGGPTPTRLTGLAQARGDFVMNLDSDNELFPWALDRAFHYFSEHPHADHVAGLMVFPDGLRVRIAGGIKFSGRDEFAAITTRLALGDSVGVVRRCVVDDWLQLPPDYYATELVFSLCMYRSHATLFIDEPWGRYHMDAVDRVTTAADPRRLEDIGRFVRDFRPLIGTTPCGPVDLALADMCMLLLRAGRFRQALPLASWMRERGISLPRALSRKALWALEWRMQMKLRRVYVY